MMVNFNNKTKQTYRNTFVEIVTKKNPRRQNTQNSLLFRHHDDDTQQPHHLVFSEILPRA